MRKKSKSHPKSDLPVEKKPLLDMDPTSNNQLHRDLWNRLAMKLRKSNAEDTWVPLPDSIPLELPLEDRLFGRNLRRILNNVVAAVLNPGEQKLEQQHGNFGNPLIKICLNSVFTLGYRRIPRKGGQKGPR
jgi:hypothetical protein